MKQSTLLSVIPLVIAFIFSTGISAQTPGLIVKPKNGPGTIFLNPNGDRYSSATTAGYTTNDITQSEIPYKVVPPAISEGSTDVQNGPTGGFTDLVSAVDGSGFYAYYDGTNIMFRLRMGGVNNGSKAYSVLLDTDLKFGNSGPYADPNYVGPTAGGAEGNPGFEYEVVYYSHSGVVVYNVDGKTDGTVVASYPLGTKDMISVALSRTDGDADYFFDFGCPVTNIGSPAIIRMVATSVISPHPALKGKASDIYGIDDNTRGSVANAWKKVIDAQCGFTVTQIGSGGTGICATCTNAPVITSVGTPGVNRPVSGTWTSMDPSKPNTATISLYRNGTLVGTTVATTGMGWTINVATIYSNDVFYAMAKATNESECLKSTPIRSGTCGTLPATPVITDLCSRGIQGTIPLGAEVYIYHITGANTITLLTTNLVYTDNATNRTFGYAGPAGNGANPCQGATPDLENGTYMLRTNLNGCFSAPLYICVTNGTYTVTSTTTTSNAITLNSPVYNHYTSVSGTGAAAFEVLRLYINGEYETSITTSAAGAFTFTNLNLVIGDVLRVYSQSMFGGCITISAPQTVICFSQRPAIYTNSSGNLISTATTITGTSPDKGGTINLYRGTPGSGTLIANTTVTNNGTWAVIGLTLTAGETYYATTTVYCESAASEVATVLPPTPVCPVITGSYTELSGVVNGTVSPSFTGLIRLYIDGAPIDSVSVVNATSWSIPVNTTPTNYIYTDGKLRVTAEGPGFAENVSCNATVTIQCTPPSIPNVTPTYKLTNTGYTVTFNVSNSVDSLMYSLADVNGADYGKTVFGNNGGLDIPSYPFNSVGTFNLELTCFKLTGNNCKATVPIQVQVVAVVMPVKFINVTAKKLSDRSNEITWKVSNEEDISYYHVERSLDGNKFDVVGTVNSQSTTESIKEYGYNDNALADNKKVFYRIKGMNVNGSPAISKVVSISETSKLTIQLSPNPASSQTTLYINSDKAQTTNIEVIDLNGRVVQNKSIHIEAGNNAITIGDLNKLVKGQYIVKVNTSTEPYYLKLVIQ